MRSTMPRTTLGSALLRREWSEGVWFVAEALAPFGLELPEGTPLDTRRPVVFRRPDAAGPVVVVHLEIPPPPGRPDGSPAGSGQVPRSIQLLAEALARISPESPSGLRVLCAPPGWEPDSSVVREATVGGDFEIRIDIPGAIRMGDVSRRLRVHIGSNHLRQTLARWLEEHPLLYGLATVSEFSVKHPLFGQVLCGGPCGLSGAWQLTCTMAKTFVSRREIEQSFLDRPVFERMRRHPDAHIRRRWELWERILLLMLRPAMALRRLIVAASARLPRSWFVSPGGWLAAASTRLLNDLECPKGLRNGACGAPTAKGLCGELLKYGVTKPCVFVYRNARDRRGTRFAAALLERAKSLEGSGKCRPLAAALRMLAAIVDRRRLSLRRYPRIDPTLPGASAIVNAMAGRFSGATVFAAPEHLPGRLCRSSISVDADGTRWGAVLDRATAALRGIPRDIAHAPEVLATILATVGEPRRTAVERATPAGSIYERILTVRSR